MVLGIYDLSGIQRYIFSTSKLREQVGGSKILHNILYKELPKVLNLNTVQSNTSADAWEKSDTIILNSLENQIVYIGGGNAVVLFKCLDSARQVTRALQKKTLELTGGDITLCYAYLDLDEDECKCEGKLKKYSELYSILMKRLIRFKNSASPIKTAYGFGFDVYDPITFKPLILQKNPTETKSEGKMIVDTLSRLERLKSYQEKNDERSKEFSFTDQFEDFRTFEHKSYVAVVHIDGDSMGGQIESATRTFSSDLGEAMIQMKNLSVQIDDLYRETFYETIKKQFGSTDESVKTAESSEKFDENSMGKIPFRPIILDGDDITFIISAEKAFQFVESFMLNLRKMSQSKERFALFHEYKFKVSASAGIAFVHVKYPFDEAYSIAEELCSFSKKLKRNNPELANTSSMDFHIVRGSGKQTVKEYREENYIKGDCVLNRRPYLYLEQAETATGDATAVRSQVCSQVCSQDLISMKEKYKIHDYKIFKDLSERMNSFWNLDDRGIARNKVKLLRDAYGEGEAYAKRVLESIHTAYSKDRLGVAEAYMENEEGLSEKDKEKKKIATLFDAIDVLDFGGELEV